MLLVFAHFAVIAQMAVASTVGSAVAPTPRAVPFDTSIAVTKLAGVALNLEAGGRVRIVGGSTKLVRVLVTDHGQHCGDCIVAVSSIGNGLDVRTGRTRDPGRPADLEIQVEVPTQT